MNSVGIDLHKRRSHIAVVSDDGRRLLSRRIDNDPETFLELLREIDGESRIAVEATYGWEWLADVLEEAGYELHLAHPLRTKAIASARVKTDSVDALMLAHLLCADLLPEAYIAPRELRDLRDLLRHRVALTHMRSALKNRVHALLSRQGIRPEHTDLFGKAGSLFLSQLELREPPSRRLDSLLSLSAAFDREIAATTREIDQLARRDDRVDVLCQIRGVGPYTAMLVIAEIGDISRSQKARKLCAWAGLTRPRGHPTARPASATSAARARGRCAGRSSRRPSTAPAAAARCVRTSSGSPNGGAERSPRSRSRARSSPSATTACATERSVAWRAAAGRAREQSRRPHDEARRPLRMRRRRRARCGRSGELALCHGLPT
jgi:transposase